MCQCFAPSVVRETQKFPGAGDGVVELCKAHPREGLTKSKETKFAVVVAAQWLIDGCVDAVREAPGYRKATLTANSTTAPTAIKVSPRLARWGRRCPLSPSITSEPRSSRSLARETEPTQTSRCADLAQERVVTRAPACTPRLPRRCCTVAAPLLH